MGQRDPAGLTPPGWELICLPCCRLGGKVNYQDFLKCLSLYSQDIISKGELMAMVVDLLGRSQDLMVGPNLNLYPCLDSISACVCLEVIGVAVQEVMGPPVTFSRPHGESVGFRAVKVLEVTSLHTQGVTRLPGTFPGPHRVAHPAFVGIRQPQHAGGQETSWDPPRTPWWGLSCLCWVSSASSCRLERVQLDCPTPEQPEARH